MASSNKDELAVPCLGIVDKPCFDIFMACVVIINMGLLSVETEVQGDATVWARVNEGFLLTYLLEAALRFLRHGLKALHDPITVMDVILVIIAFFDRLASENSLARALPVLRSSRILRLLVRLPYFKNSHNLFVLVSNSYKASMTLLWVVLLLLVILWSCATWTKEVLGASPAWVGSMDPTVEHEPFSSFDNYEYFGSVLRSVLSLLQLMTLSQWADNIARPIVQVYPLIFIFFWFFLAATAYGLLMCVVSNVVQDAITAAKRVAWRQQEDERQQRLDAAQRALKIFAVMDENGDGVLTVDELREALDTSDLEVILKDLQVPILDPDKLFSLFDRDGDGEVNQEEFVKGIVNMNEEVRPRDFVKLSIWVWNLMMRAQKLMEKLNHLEQQVLQLKEKLQGGFDAMHRFLSTHEDNSLRRRAIKAIRAAPPELPLEVTEVEGTSAQEALPRRSLVREDGTVALLESEPVTSPRGRRSVTFPVTPEQASKKRAKEEPLRWVTVASLFVTIRDRPHLAGNHIGALKPGDLLEFEDTAEGPLQPEQLSQQQFLRCWKLDGREGQRGTTGFVVGFTPSSGPHFAPEGSESAKHLLSLMAPVTVATPPRLASPGLAEKAVGSSRKREVLPHAPSSADRITPVEEEDKYGMQGVVENPNLSQLKELLS